MGWISERHMKQGGSLNRHPEIQRRGPLRKIVKVVRERDTIFGAQRVELECGHRISAWGDYRARCDQCSENKKSG